jgi:hypothetical protein
MKQSELRAAADAMEAIEDLLPSLEWKYLQGPHRFEGDGNSIRITLQTQAENLEDAEGKFRVWLRIKGVLFANGWPDDAPATSIRACLDRCYESIREQRQALDDVLHSFSDYYEREDKRLFKCEGCGEHIEEGDHYLNDGEILCHYDCDNPKGTHDAEPSCKLCDQPIGEDGSCEDDCKALPTPDGSKAPAVKCAECGKHVYVNDSILISGKRYHPHCIED